MAPNVGRRTLAITALLLCACCAPALAGEETCDKDSSARPEAMQKNLEYVITMNAGSMGPTINSAEHNVLLVLYYEEWCQLCKLFMEKYAAAAAILADAGYKNIFARILAEQQGVDQMVEKVPTLKLFNLNNDTLHVYRGKLEVQPVVEYVAKFIGLDPKNMITWGLDISEQQATAFGWTEWINSEPPSHSGDGEMLMAIRNADHPYWTRTKHTYHNICDGEDPINIQCRSISGVASRIDQWNETGQKFEVPCEMTKGLMCRHCHNNPECDGEHCRRCNSGCLDYEVRYKCCQTKCGNDRECPKHHPVCSHGCCKQFSDVMAEPLVEENVVQRGVTADGQEFVIEKMDGEGHDLSIDFQDASV